MALTLDSLIDGILDRLNAGENEFWLNSNFLMYTTDFLRRDDAREACWHQQLDSSKSTVASQTDYDLPADHWRTFAIYWTVAGTDEFVDPGGVIQTRGRTKWVLWDGKLRLTPAPTSSQVGYTIKHYYLRTPEAPATTAATLDMPDALGEALQLYLMGRAAEKGGPEMASQAAQYLADAQGRIGEAILARRKALGAPGFHTRVRW